jgi:hypothetical protein
MEKTSKIIMKLQEIVSIRESAFRVASNDIKQIRKMYLGKQKRCQTNLGSFLNLSSCHVLYVIPRAAAPATCFSDLLHSIYKPVCLDLDENDNCSMSS